MKRIVSLTVAFIILCTQTYAQGQQQEQNLQETARSFMRSGDFDNAILVLNRALQSDNKNLDLQKDLVMA